MGETIPRVFEATAVTITVSPLGFRVYAGPNELSLYSKAEVIVSRGDKPYVRLTYPSGIDANAKLRVDEEFRLLQALGWVRVE